MDSCFCYRSYCRLPLAGKSGNKTFGTDINFTLNLFNQMLKGDFYESSRI